MEKAERETVLIVDDEVDLRNAIVAYLTQEGYDVQAASNGEEALDRVKSVPFDILVTDMKLPGIDGTTVLQEALSLYPELIGVIITGYGTVENAVQAMKKGAYDYIAKPVSACRNLSRDQTGARAKAPERGKRLPQDSAEGEVPLREHCRKQQADAGSLPDGRDDIWNQ